MHDTPLTLADRRFAFLTALFLCMVVMMMYPKLGYGATLLYSEGFESGNTSSLEPHLLTPPFASMTAVGSPARTGAKSVRFDLQLQKGLDTYRAEGYQPKNNTVGDFNFNTEYWIGFSTYYQTWDYDVSSESAGLQIHRRPGSWADGCGGQESAYSVAPFALMSGKDVLSIGTYGGIQSWKTNIVKNKWYDFVIHFDIGWDANSYIEAWVDGKKVFLRSGPNFVGQYDNCGFAWRPSYINYGIYKWDWRAKNQATRPTITNRRTMYMDNLAIAQGPDGYNLVAPAPLDPTAPQVTITANPATLPIGGGSATLSWSGANITTCTASGGWSGAKAVSGTETVSLTTTQTYTLSCTGPKGTVTSSATVTVGSTPPPPPTTDTTPPSVPTISTITSLPSMAVLTWTASTDNVGVVGYRVYRNGVLTAGVPGRSISNTVPASGTYTYTVSAYDAAGNESAKSAPRTVTVVGGPIIPPILPPDGTPTANLTLGQSATIRWTTQYTTSCTASGAWTGTKPTSGSQVVTPPTIGTHIYVLSCSGPGGGTTRTVRAVVTQ